MMCSTKHCGALSREKAVLCSTKRWGAVGESHDEFDVLLHQMLEPCPVRKS